MNREGQALVELMARNGLAFVGSFFQKRESHKITHRSGYHKTDLDLVLVRKEQLWKIKDCKAIAGEHTTTQHKPVVFVVRMKRTTPNKIVGRKTLKWWKCRDGVATEYRQRVKEKYEELGEEADNVEEEWKKYQDAFVGNAEELCGRSTGMGGKARKNQEWWTTEVASAIREKKEAWKVIEHIKVNGNQPDGGMLHLYGQKKKAAKKAVDKARNDMEADVYTKPDDDAGKMMIYKMARHRNENSNDVKRGTFITDRNGKLVTNREQVLKVCEGHYSELLNHEGNMSDLELPNYVHEKVNVIEITDMEVTSGLKGMNKGRAPGCYEMRAEMVDVAGEIGARWTQRLLNACMRQCKVPEDWRIGLIVPIWKRKGDAQDPGKYRGITLLSHIMKLLERILDKRLREKVEHKLGEEQLGFRKGRGTTDGMFALRQLVEQRLEMQGHMALAFVDLEKAVDTVPRKMATATLRWMGAPESEGKMVEAMYENTTGRVVAGSGMSNAFQVNISL